MGLLAAVRFLTIVSVPRRGRSDPARSQGYFPIVGLGLGLALVGLDRAFSRVLPGEAVNWLLVASLLVLTGGMHLDGLADTCDGVFGGHGRSREQRLEIMGDARAGAFAVMGIVLILALKWAAVSSLARESRVEGILLAPCLGRWAMVSAIAVFPYARRDGMGLAFHQAAGRWPLVAAAGTAMGAAGLLLGWAGLLIWLGAGLSGMLLGAYCWRVLGGLTGDVYGAITETVEVMALLLLAAGGQRGWLEPLLLA